MSYLIQSGKYEIVPLETYRIVRSCSGCGGKAVYQSTGKIRVNANGKLLDIWLIYQCTQCKHTYNLPIYSRIRKNELSRAELFALQQNDSQLAFQLGLNRPIFQRSGAKIAQEPPYRLDSLPDEAEKDTICFVNPYQLSLRPDKLLAECLHISRSAVKKLLQQEYLIPEKMTGSEMIYHICRTVQKDFVG